LFGIAFPAPEAFLICHGDPDGWAILPVVINPLLADMTGSACPSVRQNEGRWEQLGAGQKKNSVVELQNFTPTPKRVSFRTEAVTRGLVNASALVLGSSNLPRRAKFRH